MCVSVMQHSMTQARSRLDSGVTLGIVKTGLCLSILWFISWIGLCIYIFSISCFYFFYFSMLFYFFWPFFWPP